MLVCMLVCANNYCTWCSLLFTVLGLDGLWINCKSSQCLCPHFNLIKKIVSERILRSPLINFPPKTVHHWRPLPGDTGSAKRVYKFTVKTMYPELVESLLTAGRSLSATLYQESDRLKGEVTPASTPSNVAENRNSTFLNTEWIHKVFINWQRILIHIWLFDGFTGCL